MASPFQKALEAALGPSASGRSLSELADAAAARYGSRRAASRELGIPETTLRRWSHGGTAKPAATSAARVENLRTEVRRDLAQVLPTDPARFTVKTRDDGSVRTRSITADRLGITAAGMRLINDAYVEGGEQAAARQFAREIKEPWYRAYFLGHGQPVQPGDTPTTGGITGFSW